VQGSFHEQLAQPRPDPGGGAAAAYACALGVALVEKAIRPEIQRQTGPPAAYWPEALAEVHRLSSILDELRDKDCAAYWKLAERRASAAIGADLESDIAQAVACPAEAIETAGLALKGLSHVVKRCKPHLTSDLQVACELMAAGITGSYHIAAATLRLLPNESLSVRGQLDLSARLDSAIKLLETVRQELVLRTRLPLRNR
jgi:formiminotetrahydrofolate cyclodeaminase